MDGWMGGREGGFISSEESGGRGCNLLAYRKG